MRLSALRLPLVPGAIFSWRGGWQSSGAKARRENARHCERSEAIQGGCVRRWIAPSLAPLAMTRMHPPPRVARGRGTMRSMVEGVCGAEAGREAEPFPPPFGRSPFPLRGGRMKRGDHAARTFFVRPPRDSEARQDKATAPVRRGRIVVLAGSRGATSARHISNRRRAQDQTRRQQAAANFDTPYRTPSSATAPRSDPLRHAQRLEPDPSLTSRPLRPSAARRRDGGAYPGRIPLCYLVARMARATL